MSISLIKKLGLMPPNELTPVKLAQYFDEQEYAFVSKHLAGHRAVGASKSWLGYSKVGKGVSKLCVALIGKGITFDSGGISIKPSHNMHHMKFDMLGAATVLALARDLSKSPVTFHLYGCCAENTFHGNDTMRPSDVLTYDDGTTVEIINTDAEGRLILADGILAAKRHDPDLIITIATLTGAAKAALGEGTAIFGNCQGEIDNMLVAATECDELLWQLPIWDQHREDIKGQKGVSDLKNQGTIAGASTAAAFLEHFAGETHWIHLDIAGSAYKNDIPTGAMYKTLKQFLGKLI